ncbi:MAG: pilus assembly protein N-terminal domain-containing protein [Candidatus Eisenbacteria bacterium]|nr:pilus assembly protein N-terminal domain-containing protein [Candidatus Eisenbacteria bacterium]
MFRMRGFAWFVISGLLLMASGSLWPASAAAVPAGSLLKMEVVIGKSQVLAFTENITRVSVTDPNIADVMVASPRQILINGKAAGTTSMVVWDSEDRPMFYDLVVHTDTSFQQVMLKVRFAEVNRTALKNLGIDLVGNEFVKIDLDPSEAGEKFTDLTVGSFSGLVATPSIPLSVTSGVSMFVSLTRGDYDISGILKALEKKGYVNTLAEPTLVSISGHEAKFLAGGEIPVPIVTPTGGGVTVTIEWKEFGVSLTFTPTVVDSGVVNLKVEPEVSTLDWDNGVTLSGFRIPALRTRKAQSTVELRDGQTLAIGGLITSEEVRSVSKMPILGDIPIIGLLFKSTSFMKNESEVVMLVTPKIVTSYSALEVPTWPGTGKASAEK